jgi:TDG/mug DNA glycosylase family protein
MRTVLNSFPPIANDQSRILILGSMPGVKSLEMQQYYAHPQNRFWLLMREILAADLPDTYESRKETLVENHIALWDVLKHCKRNGSLDSDIENDSMEPNGFQTFLNEHPQIHSVLFNGRKAESEFFRSVLPMLPRGIVEKLDFYSLPSTSPANAGIPNGEKRRTWKDAIQFALNVNTVRLGRSAVELKVYGGGQLKHSNDIVLFIHGLGCTATSFLPFEDFILPEDFEFVAPTLPGFASSEEQKIATLESMTGRCLELCQHLDAQSIHIVGHSMGGAVGLLVAQELGDRVLSYASLEGNLITADCEMLSRKIAKSSLEELERKRLPRMIRNTQKSSDPGLRLWANQLRTVSPRQLRAQSQSLVEWSDSGKLLELFNDLTCPKMYLYGDRNSEMPIVNQLNTEDTQCILNSGHFLMQDNPVECWKTLQNLWSK